MVEAGITRSFLVVARAGIDEDDVVGRPYKPSMYTHHKGIAALFHIDSGKPRLDRPKFLRSGSRIEKRGRDVVQILLLHLPHRHAGNTIFLSKIAHGISFRVELEPGTALSDAYGQ